jgi:hypothetical protein
MKRKLARKRAQGYEGWDELTSHEIAQRLIGHCLKGDPVDIANFCVFLAEAELTKAERRRALRKLHHALLARFPHPGFRLACRQSPLISNAHRRRFFPNFSPPPTQQLKLNRERGSQWGFRSDNRHADLSLWHSRPRLCLRAKIFRFRAAPNSAKITTPNPSMTWPRVLLPNHRVMTGE